MAIMELGGTALRSLRNAVVGVFIAALCAGIFLPVYTDEVGWRFQERAALDGVDKLFNDACGPNTLAVPPFFMMPVRYYSAFFNTSFADPFYIRVSGILYAFLWCALLLILIRRAAENGADRVLLAVVGIGLVCFGTQPLLMVWSRPEQPILLAVTAALVLTWTSGGDLSAPASTRAAWMRSAGIVLLAIFAFSYHLKAVFLSPVFLACLFFASRGREANLPRLVMGALFVVVAGWSAHYWIHRLQCPDDPILFAAYAKNNIGMELTSSRNWAELSAGLGKIVGNATVLKYFDLPVPRPDPLSNWLEPGQLGKGASDVWFRALIFLWFGALLLALACMVTRVRETWRTRRLDARFALAVVLLGTVMAWSATQAIRNVYEASLALPLIMLVIVFALAARVPGERIERWVKVLAIAVGLGALVSPVAIAAIYAPSLARATEQKGYIPAQPYSLPVFGYAGLKDDIVGAARLCGIGDPAAAQALMVDDLTYFAFMKSRLPQHQLGILSVWRGSIKDPMAYLRSRGSSGAILGCHLLPEELRRRARRQGQFCCLSPAAL